jgi:hypothetical protein
MVKYYFFGSIAILGVLTFITSKRIEIKSIEKAGNRPFCIQIPRNGEYVEAKNLYDLSLFKMQASGGNNHAVLIVGSEEKPNFFHWSYLNRSFDEGAYGPPPIFCKPRIDFISKMSSYHEDTENLNFYFMGQNFSVPRVYFPAVNWASRNALIFYAESPEFAPLPNKDVHDGFIDIVFGKSPLLPSWLNINDDRHWVEKAEPEFGLQKQLVWYRGNSSSSAEISKFASTQYYIRAGDENITTLIICISSNCRHIFEHNGWSYYFSHKQKDLANWNSIQTKLDTLVRSFIVKN